MKRTIVIIAALALLAIPRNADAQKHRSYVIGFYNLENLFDTYHDEGKNDYEYLPDGANEWTEEKYAKKLRNMARCRYEKGQRRLACRPRRIRG